MRPETEKFSDALSRLFRESDLESSNKTSEESNVQTAVRFYRALGEQDLTEAKGCLCQKVYHCIFGPEDFLPSGQDEGPDAMIEHMGSVFGLLEDQTPEALRVVAQGDLISIFYRDRGRVKATGAAYDVTGVHLLEFKDGKIVRLENLFDTASLERSLKGAEALL